MYICINIVLSPFLPFDYTTEIYHPIRTSGILEHPAVSIWGKMWTGSRFQPAISEMPVSIEYISMHTLDGERKSGMEMLFLRFCRCKLHRNDININLLYSCQIFHYLSTSSSTVEKRPLQ